jgi:DNA-binding NtrC family response regulator
MISVIEDYKNGNNMGESIDLFVANNPKHELAATTQLVYKTIIDPTQFEKNVEAIKSLEYSSYEVEEQLIFLEFLFWLYCSVLGRQNNAASILSVINNIVTKDLSIEFQVIPIYMQGIYDANQGHQNNLTIAYENALAVLYGKSNRYKKILWDYTIHLCNMNSFEKIEQFLPKLKAAYEHSAIPKRYDYVLLLYEINKGNWQNIKLVIDNIHEDQYLSNFYSNFLKSKLKLSQLLLENEEKIIDKNQSYDWSLLSYLYLVRKNKPEALMWARKYANKEITTKSFSSFDSYCLLRAELANENINSAEFFLEEKFKLGNESPFDIFFKFRIQRIKGNLELSQKYFNSFLLVVEKHGLQNRFDTELLLSPEITIKDLRYFMKNANANNLLHITYTIHKIQKPENNTALESMSFMIGQHSSIKEVKSLVLKFASIELSVLITGETGTGKDLVAKAIWQAGVYKNKKFIPINCGAISDHLLQSELFGHKKGSFTGASQDHKGIFEEAQGGIVFLDEIGEISPKMQVSLLRILETGEYRAIGGTETKNLNCKIIFATNRQLGELVEKGLFRQDLQFRLERLIINLPPLRERPMDIPLLVEHFLNRLNSKLPPISLDASTLKHLSTLPWEGNIRELRNETERIRLFHSDKKIIAISDLSDKYQILKTQLIKKNIETKFKNSTLDEKYLNFKSKFRKLDELKDLFETYGKLSRSETSKLLKVSLNTAANYLSTLEKENFLIRVTPTDSVKTHYFKKL